MREWVFGLGLECAPHGTREMHNNLYMEATNGLRSARLQVRAPCCTKDAKITQILLCRVRYLSKKANIGMFEVEDDLFC